MDRANEPKTLTEAQPGRPARYAEVGGKSGGKPDRRVYGIEPSASSMRGRSARWRRPPGPGRTCVPASCPPPRSPEGDGPRDGSPRGGNVLSIIEVGGPPCAHEAPAVEKLLGRTACYIGVARRAGGDSCRRRRRQALTTSVPAREGRLPDGLSLQRRDPVRQVVVVTHDVVGVDRSRWVGRRAGSEAVVDPARVGLRV